MSKKDKTPAYLFRDEEKTRLWPFRYHSPKEKEQIRKRYVELLLKKFS